MGDFSDAGSAFNPDESVALVRYFTRLLQARQAETGDALVTALAAIVAASTERHKVIHPIACARGCGSCCHQKVSVTAIEIFAVARQLRRSKAVATHRERLAARPDRSDTRRVLDPAKPCAFLAGDACSIHPVRPAICRIIVSLDVRACLRRFAAGDGILPWPRSHEAIRDWLNTILWSALEASALGARTYDFEAGVAALLADPGIEARWYGSEDALAAAADPPLPAAAFAEVGRLRALARL